jgi:outer membrane beta-barrel protein
MARAALCAWLALAVSGPLANAQEKEATPPGQEAQPPAATAPAEAPGAEGTVPSNEAVTPTLAPQEVYGVPRRNTLKRRRIEIMPTYNVSINNPLILHHGFGGNIAIYLSEALFIGLEGTYYYRQPTALTDRYFLIGADQRVIPSVNQYNWSAFLDFGYVFASGKYALFNRWVGHWETYVSAGVGVFNTQIIPRNDPTSPDIFQSYLFAGLLPGIGARMWVNRWFAIDAYLKNYLFADNLEPTTRTNGDCTPQHDCSVAKGKAQSQFTFDVTFGLGVSFFLPPGFEYKTAR